MGIYEICSARCIDTSIDNLISFSVGGPGGQGQGGYGATKPNSTNGYLDPGNKPSGGGGYSQGGALIINHMSLLRPASVYYFNTFISSCIGLIFL